MQTYLFRQAEADMIYIHGGDTRIIWSSINRHGVVLTPRRAYALEERKWETSREFKERFGRIAEACYGRVSLPIP
jgi:hypothetical protein